MRGDPGRRAQISVAALGFGQPAAPVESPVSSPGSPDSGQPFLVRGVPVELFNSRADIATADVIERLDLALALIGEHQPWRLRHLQRDIRAIRVGRYACRGAFQSVGTGHHHRTDVSGLA